MLWENIHFDVLERKDTPTPLKQIQQKFPPYTWDYRFFITEFDNNTDFQITSLITDQQGTIYERSDNILIHANEHYSVVTEEVLLKFVSITIIKHCQDLGLQPQLMDRPIVVDEFDDSKREHLR